MKIVTALDMGYGMWLMDKRKCLIVWLIKSCATEKEVHVNVCFEEVRTTFIGILNKVFPQTLSLSLDQRFR